MLVIGIEPYLDAFLEGDRVITEEKNAIATRLKAYNKNVKLR
jgi:hypothetical protein